MGAGAVQGGRHAAAHVRHQVRRQLPLCCSPTGAYRCRRGGAGGGRQREAGGRVSAATARARGVGAVGSTLQHAALRCNTLQHVVAV